MNRKFLLLIVLLCSSPAWAASIRLSAPTIKAGMSEFHSNSGMVKIPKPYYQTVAYKKVLPLAKKAYVNLDRYLDEIFIAQYKNKQFFLLFYNLAEAPSCSREYLIQKVKITKTNYSDTDQVAHGEVKYLVEVMKLNQLKKTKRADEHKKRYGLKNYSLREVHVECEIGCGEIIGVIEGDSWLYGKGELYKQLQDYSSQPQLYDDVQFDFSKKYEFRFSFDDQENVDIEWPYFLK